MAAACKKTMNLSRWLCISISENNPGAAFCGSALRSHFMISPLCATHLTVLQRGRSAGVSISARSPACGYGRDHTVPFTILVLGIKGSGEAVKGFLPLPARSYPVRFYSYLYMSLHAVIEWYQWVFTISIVNAVSNPKVRRHTHYSSSQAWDATHLTWLAYIAVLMFHGITNALRMRYG